MPGNGWCLLALLYSLTYCPNDNPNDGKEINNKFDKNDILRRFGHIQFTVYSFFSHFMSLINKNALRIKRNYTYMYMAKEGRSCEHFGGYKTVNRTTLPLCHT